MDLSRFTEKLTEEQKVKVKACKTPEELLALADEEDFELSVDELDAIAGGDGKKECKDDTRTH